MEIIRGSQNWSGNFWEFSERKTGNVPKLPLPLLLLFADENYHAENVSEHAQNNFRGYQKCSGTFWNFERRNGRGKHLVPTRGDKIPQIGGCLFGGFLSREHPGFKETC
jgi:hypothetical protein